MLTDWSTNTYTCSPGLHHIELWEGMHVDRASTQDTLVKLRQRVNQSPTPSYLLMRSAPHDSPLPSDSERVSFANLQR
jgi:hypothetical protein